MAKLDALAVGCSDNGAAQCLNEARAKLFQSINPTTRHLILVLQSALTQAHFWIGKYWGEGAAPLWQKNQSLQDMVAGFDQIETTAHEAR